MNRRRYLAAAGAAAAAGLAGCTGGENADGDATTDETTATPTSYGDVPPVLDDRPNEPYVPTHVEGMRMVGTQTAGDYACALAFTYPHRFWLVTGTRTRKVVIKRSDSVHLMPVLWNDAAKHVVPDASLQVTVERGDETVTGFRPWPMLSQPMGFHSGDNVGLPGDDTYTVTVEAGGSSARRTGGLSAFDGATFEFEWDYRDIEVQAISYRDISSSREGMPGALPPGDMMTAGMSQAPSPDSLPGSPTRVGASAGAVFHATVVDDASTYGGGSDEAYLAVSPRTTHNRYELPMMSLSATLAAGGDTVHDGPLTAAIDPDLGYHYGARIPGGTTGGRLDLSVDTPPQVSRHEGYETAFLQFDALSADL